MNSRDRDPHLTAGPKPTPQKKSVHPRWRKRWKRRLAYLLLGLLLGAALALHVVPGSVLAQRLHELSNDADLRMTTPSRSDLSLLSGRATLNDVAIYKSHHSQALLSWSTVSAQLEPLNILFGNAYSIDNLNIHGLRINVRFPNPAPHPADKSRIIAQKVAQKVTQRVTQKVKQEAEQKEAPYALDYLALLSEELNHAIEQALARYPRSSVRKNIQLKHALIHGDAILWPQPSSFDLAAFTFSVNDSDSNDRLDVDTADAIDATDAIAGKHIPPEFQQQPLLQQLHFTTKDPSSFQVIADLRTYAQGQYLVVTLRKLPSAKLHNLRLSNSINHYLSLFGPSGSCDLELRLIHSAAHTQGSVTLRSDKLRLNPASENNETNIWLSPVINNLAQRINELRKLDPSAYITWPIRWQQTAQQPLSIDYGINALLRQLNQHITALSE